MSLDRYFRFGKDRNKPGNGLKKRMSKRRKVRGKQVPRHSHKTSLLSSLLAERISEDGESPLYQVSFRKKPVVGKVFNAEEVKYVKTTGKVSDRINKIKDAYEKNNADITHVNREIENSANEDVIKSYNERLKDLLKLNKRLTRILSSPRVGLKARTKAVKLRVEEIAGFDDKFGSYICICKPV